MIWVQRILVILAGLAGAYTFYRVLWHRRLQHVWPKRDQVKIVNPGGWKAGIAEVLLHKRIIANRPWAGVFHLALFYGFLIFGIKSATHVVNGFLPHESAIHLPGWLNASLDVAAWSVLAAVVYMAIRRWFFMRDKLTHMGESTLVLGLIALLMITHLLEKPLEGIPAARVANWWVHYLTLCGFPALIAYGKHLHLLVGPVNVVLRHMTELPGDRPVAGADFELKEDEEEFEKEYARVGMPNGVIDFSFHAFFDPAACIECGRCNDACPSADAGLRPRDHFVLSFRDPTLDAEKFQELVPPDIVATCTQCRACDTVCPVGNRPARTALEIRGRYSFEGVYPPRALKDGGASPVTATGNIFGEPPSTREKLVAEAELPIYDAEQHDVLFVLGCQGANSPDAQHVVKATAKLLKAAGVKFGVLAEEQCWGEGLLHGGGLMEDWPMYWEERVAQLDEALGGDRSRTILTICPHCRDTIGTQYKQVGADFSRVVSHVRFLADLLRDGRLQIERQADDVAVHHPCKTIHHAEQDLIDEVLGKAGVTTHNAGKDPDVPSCCGGGGGGFLWDSPAKVNRKRWDALVTETGKNKVVTACPGCHRMLAVAKEEDQQLTDIADVLAERLREG